MVISKHREISIRKELTYILRENMEKHRVDHDAFFDYLKLENSHG